MYQMRYKGCKVLTKCPDGCGKEIDVIIHQGTGKKILYVKDNPNVIHQCSIPQKYHCFECDANIPYMNPCVHRRRKINPEPPKDKIKSY